MSWLVCCFRPNSSETSHSSEIFRESDIKEDERPSSQLVVPQETPRVTNSSLITEQLQLTALHEHAEAGVLLLLDQTGTRVVWSNCPTTSHVNQSICRSATVLEQLLGPGADVEGVLQAASEGVWQASNIKSNLVAELLANHQDRQEQQDYATSTAQHRDSPANTFSGPATDSAGATMEQTVVREPHFNQDTHSSSPFEILGGAPVGFGSVAHISSVRPSNKPLSAVGLRCPKDTTSGLDALVARPSTIPCLLNAARTSEAPSMYASQPLWKARSSHGSAAALLLNPSTATDTSNNAEDPDDECLYETLGFATSKSSKLSGVQVKGPSMVRTSAHEGLGSMLKAYQSAGSNNSFTARQISRETSIMSPTITGTQFTRFSALMNALQNGQMQQSANGNISQAPSGTHSHAHVSPSSSHNHLAVQLNPEQQAPDLRNDVSGLRSLSMRPRATTTPNLQIPYCRAKVTDPGNTRAHDATMAAPTDYESASMHVHANTGNADQGSSDHGSSSPTPSGGLYTRAATSPGHDTDPGPRPFTRGKYGSFAGLHHLHASHAGTPSQQLNGSNGPAPSVALAGHVPGPKTVAMLHSLGLDGFLAAGSSTAGSPAAGMLGEFGASGGSASAQGGPASAMSCRSPDAQSLRTPAWSRLPHLRPSNDTSRSATPQEHTPKASSQGNMAAVRHNSNLNDPEDLQVAGRVQSESSEMLRVLMSGPSASRRHALGAAKVSYAGVEPITGRTASAPESVAHRLHPQSPGMQSCVAWKGDARVEGQTCGDAPLSPPIANRKDTSSYKRLDGLQASRHRLSTVQTVYSAPQSEFMSDPHMQRPHFLGTYNVATSRSAPQQEFQNPQQAVANEPTDVTANFECIVSGAEGQKVSAGSSDASWKPSRRNHRLLQTHDTQEAECEGCVDPYDTTMPALRQRPSSSMQADYHLQQPSLMAPPSHQRSSSSSRSKLAVFSSAALDKIVPPVSFGVNGVPYRNRNDSADGDMPTTATEVVEMSMSSLARQQRRSQEETLCVREPSSVTFTTGNARPSHCGYDDVIQINEEDEDFNDVQYGDGPGVAAEMGQGRHDAECGINMHRSALVDSVVEEGPVAEVTIRPVKQRNLPAGCPPLWLVSCVDISARSAVEALLMQLTESQLAMVSQMFPLHVIEYLSLPKAQQVNPSLVARQHKDVTILFMDVVGFTAMSKEVEPHQVMEYLNEVFSLLDEVVTFHNLHKVETAGDCYIVSAGVLECGEGGFLQVAQDHDPVDNARAIMACAKDMMALSSQVLMPHNGQPTKIRIGIHTGNCTSGLIGSKLPKWSVYGDSINTASRMESTSLPGRVQVSDVTYALLPEETWQPTGGIHAKGKGTLMTYLWIPPPDFPCQPCSTQSITQFQPLPPPPTTLSPINETEFSSPLQFTESCHASSGNLVQSMIQSGSNAYGVPPARTKLNLADVASPLRDHQQTGPNRVMHGDRDLYTDHMGASDHADFMQNKDEEQQHGGPSAYKGAATFRSGGWAGRHADDEYHRPRLSSKSHDIISTAGAVSAMAASNTPYCQDSGVGYDSQPHNQSYARCRVPRSRSQSRRMSVDVPASPQMFDDVMCNLALHSSSWAARSRRLSGTSPVVPLVHLLGPTSPVESSAQRHRRASACARISVTSATSDRSSRASRLSPSALSQHPSVFLSPGCSAVNTPEGESSAAGGTATTAAAAATSVILSDQPDRISAGAKDSSYHSSPHNLSKLVIPEGAATVNAQPVATPSQRTRAAPVPVMPLRERARCLLRTVSSRNLTSGVGSSGGNNNNSATTAGNVIASLACSGRMTSGGVGSAGSQAPVATTSISPPATLVTFGSTCTESSGINNVPTFANARRMSSIADDVQRSSPTTPAVSGAAGATSTINTHAASMVAAAAGVNATCGTHALKGSSTPVNASASNLIQRPSPLTHSSPGVISMGWESGRDMPQSQRSQCVDTLDSCSSPTHINTAAHSNGKLPASAAASIMTQSRSMLQAYLHQGAHGEACLWDGVRTSGGTPGISQHSDQYFPPPPVGTQRKTARGRSIDLGRSQTIVPAPSAQRTSTATNVSNATMTGHVALPTGDTPTTPRRQRRRSYMQQQQPGASSPSRAASAAANCCSSSQGDFSLSALMHAAAWTALDVQAESGCEIKGSDGKASSSHAMTPCPTRPASKFSSQRPTKESVAVNMSHAVNTSPDC